MCQTMRGILRAGLTTAEMMSDNFYALYTIEIFFGGLLCKSGRTHVMSAMPLLCTIAITC